ncbi:efflux RND transporter periplasmic adaptor subunit [Lyngbya sp. CCY1209]|uniref:efflux RND transporter periplasmic adaptor subunit n=1 Tax=Lyngbya sp. CCY1209 TaxID=2886103 RepID=UPI002D1FD3F9|nr:efflux RND transporter periplasmic adaptor subunit [Lyngbya sp. CCY1209]MEB3883407.1 efflux RND transporter periplasmic adaptor subunit [Lyngbya sp. CCY1209]
MNKTPSKAIGALSRIASLPLLAAVALLSACSGQPQAAGPPPVPVEIEKIDARDVKDSSEYNARVEGVENSIIRPRVSGWVKQVYVRLGQRVEAGDPLMQIDSSQQQANFENRLATVEGRRAALKGAEAELEALRANLTRTRAELEFQSQGANLQRAERELDAQIDERQRLEFELENSQENLQAAVRELERRQAIRQQRQAAYERYEKLWEEGVISSELYDEKLRDRQTSEAEVANQEKEVLAARARVEAARANLSRQGRTIEASRAQVESAGRDLDRQIATLEADIARQEKAIEAQEAQLALLEREIQGARANAVAEQVQLDYYTINAPIGGIVGDIPVKVGDLVDSQTTLTSIRQNQNLEVNIDIPIGFLPQLRVGTPVELIAQETGEAIGTSRISYIAPNAGTGTQTILVKAIYPNQNNELRTDQIVRARVIWEQASGVTVPTTAITRIGAQSFVFRVEEQQTDAGETMLVAKQVPVQLGSIQGQSFEVISGVKAGDRIVSEGVIKLRNGVPIVDRTNDREAASTPQQ